MNWPRHFVAGLAILTIIIFENVSSYSNLDRAKRSEAEHDAGPPLYLTPLINANELEYARTAAQVQFPVLGTNRESYAGFLTVNEETDTNLFFWFISAKFNPDRAPVIVYLEGGPGRTLFFNLFHQHGPFNLRAKGELTEETKSMNNWYNMIYIDSPAGTGFSFMNEDGAYATNQIQIAADLLEALKQFFKMCAHFRRNDFYVAGESMAGKIVPALTSAIHWDNKKVSAAEKINLKGMIIGNGFMDPENQLAYGKYLNAMGLVDGKTASQLQFLETQAQSIIGANNHAEAYGVVTNLFDLLRQKVGYCSASNIRLTSEFRGDPYNFVPWLDRSDVRKALHVGNEPFTVLSYKTMQALKGDMTRSIAFVFGQMLENYRTLVYTGSFSIACPYSSVHQSLLQIQWSGKAQFAAAPRRQWRVDEELGYKALAGYVRNYGNLYEVLVRNTGHFPSQEEPFWIVDLLNKFTQNSL